METKSLCVNCSKGWHDEDCHKPDLPEKEDWEKLEVLLQLMPDNGNLIRGLVNNLLAKQKEEIIKKLEGMKLPTTNIERLKAYNLGIDDCIEAIKQI